MRMIVHVKRAGSFIEMMVEGPSVTAIYDRLKLGKLQLQMKFVKYSLRIDTGRIYPVQMTTLYQYIVSTWKPRITVEINGTSFVRKKVKQSHYSPGQALRVPEVEAPRFQDSRHMKVVRLASQRTGRLYPPGNIPGTHFC